MYEYKQRHILKTALKLFRNYGLRVVTMDEIARGAGMSKKTIYQYFKDKNDLIDSLYSSIINILKNRLNKIQASQYTQITQYIKMIELALEARQYITKTTMEDLKKFHAVTHKKLQHFSDNNFITAVTQCIEIGRNNGLYQPIFNSSLMAMICLSELDFLNETDNKKLAGLSPAEIKQQVIRHLIYGIATPAGKKDADKYFQTLNH